MHAETYHHLHQQSLTLIGAGKTKPTRARTVVADGIKSSSESELEDGVPATADDNDNTSSAATPCPDSSDEAPVLETSSVPDSESTTGNPIFDEEDNYDREDDPDYELGEGDEGDEIGDDFDDDSDGESSHPSTPSTEEGLFPPSYNDLFALTLCSLMITDLDKDEIWQGPRV